MSGRLLSNTLRVFVDHAHFCSGQSCKQALFTPIGVFLGRFGANCSPRCDSLKSLVSDVP
jgi:hypothetical protein